jgi:hypothetical protein
MDARELSPIQRLGFRDEPPNNKKASAASPAGHDYRQPKLEEGTDAFWQIR